MSTHNKPWASIRQATPAELAYGGAPLNLAEDFRDALTRGNVVDAFVAGGGVRVVRIFEGQDGHDGSSILGYGEDSIVENALRRARDTYAKREQRGQSSIDFRSGEYPEIGIGLLTGGETGSPLDAIVHAGHGLRILQDGEDVVAKTDYGWHSREGVEARGSDAQTAVDGLVAALRAAR